MPARLIPGTVFIKKRGEAGAYVLPSLPVFYPASLFPISKLNALQIKSLALGIIPI